MALADEHNGLILDAAIRSKQPLIPKTVNAKSTASAMVVLLFIDDDTKIVRLKLDIIQLRVQLLDLTTVRNAVWLFAKSLDFAFDFPRLCFSISDAVQFVQPAENLTVGEGDYLVILSCFCNGERELPFRLSQAAAMKLENVFLTY